MLSHVDAPSDGAREVVVSRAIRGPLYQNFEMSQPLNTIA
jgi:hypothetical protein